jgi:predicted CopG family antitoxin
MSTKTIALDSQVYDKLVHLKRQSESFSKVINRLIDRVVTAHTAAEVLTHLDGQAPLSDADAETMTKFVRESRDTESWPSHDLS